MCSFVFHRYKIGEPKRKPFLSNVDLKRHIERGPDSAFSIYFEVNNWRSEASHFLLALSGAPQDSLQPVTEEEYFLLFNGQIYNTIEIANLCDIDDVENIIDTKEYEDIIENVRKNKLDKKNATDNVFIYEDCKLKLQDVNLLALGRKSGIVISKLDSQLEDCGFESHPILD
jgi:asparagine synthetase B (glutamine-hydrolysing)